MGRITNNEILGNIFKDLVVVEFSSVLAGPAVGMFFAELGSKVIKIENKRTGGDVTRRWKIKEEDPSSLYSAYWCCVNLGKESQLLDLTDASDQKIAIEIVKTADVMISNFKPSSSSEFRMDYETLSALNPSLIYAQVSGFEDDDNRPAFDVVMQAEAGFMAMTGEPGRDPVKMPVALIDLMAAHQLKEGILIALLKRFHSGKGSYVKTSLIEAAISSLANQATNWLMSGHIPQRLGSKHPNIAPYGDVFYTKEGKPIVLAAGTDQQFQKLCEVLGIRHLANDERFASNAQRVRNREILVSILAPPIARFLQPELLEKCMNQGIPAGMIRDMQSVFEMQVAQKMVVESPLPDGTLGKCVRTIAFEIA